ncbi:unnamed protein product, partial [Rotaria sp. Silwood1]
LLLIRENHHISLYGA